MWKYAASPQHCFSLHTHTQLWSRHTHRNKETVSRAQLAPSAGGRGGQKYPLKGYIPRDIYSLRRRLGFQTSSTAGSNYNVFDGSTNTHTRQCGRWPLRKKKSRSVRKFSQNHCWGLWWSLIKEMPSLLVGTFGWEDISHILSAPTKNLLQSSSLSRYVMNCYN